jgi:agmatinase
VSTDMIPAGFMTGRVEDADVVLMGIPYGQTLSGMKGAERSPRAICRQLIEQVEDVDQRIFRLSNEHILSLSDNQTPFGLEGVIKICECHLDQVRQLKDPFQMVKIVTSRALELLKQNKFLVGLGGEHTVSLGLVSAVREFFDDLTVVQIDAHADLRWDTSDYDPKPKDVAHSTVMRHIHNSGVEIRQYGIRSMSRKELEYAAQKGMMKKHIFFARSGSSPEALINSIKTKYVYLSIDVDGFDPSIMPATGTPEPGGLLWGPVLFLTEELQRLRNVVGVDLVEVSQGKEFSEADRIRTAYNSALLIHQALCMKFRKFCK